MDGELISEFAKNVRMRSITQPMREKGFDRKKKGTEPTEAMWFV